MTTLTHRSVLALLALLAGYATPVRGQNLVDVVATPYAGILFNQQEKRLPVSPVVGGSVILQLAPPRQTSWKGFETFVGADVAVAAVDEALDEEATALHLNLYVSGRAGFALPSYGQPRIFGFVGRAWPSPDLVWNAERKEWEGAQSSLNMGGGLSFTAFGLMLEGRVMRDRRFAGEGASVVLVLGYGSGDR